jgi:hypothetical protein
VVVDHFHAIRLADIVVDQTRQRLQQATLGHRGREQDPLHCISSWLQRPSSSPADIPAGRHLTGFGSHITAVPRAEVSVPLVQHWHLGDKADHGRPLTHGDGGHLPAGGDQD